jgi:hypothetical protein
MSRSIGAPSVTGEVSIGHQRLRISRQCQGSTVARIVHLIGDNGNGVCVAAQPRRYIAVGVIDHSGEKDEDGAIGKGWRGATGVSERQLRGDVHTAVVHQSSRTG